MTLIQILTGSISYDSSFAVYAEKINGEFRPESPARFGQTAFENGSLLDDSEMFSNNELIVDSLESWCNGDADAVEEAAEMLISEINESAN